MVEHNYRQIPGWFDFEDIYREAVERAKNGSQFCEVGTYMGKSLSFLATEIVNSGKNIWLSSVDSTFVVDVTQMVASDGTDPVSREAARFNGRDLRDVLAEQLAPSLDAGLVWTHFQMTSEEAAEVVTDASFDFVFIDANHTYEAVAKDLWKWWPKVKPGGWMAGHDFTPAFPGVVRAVCEAFPEVWAQQGSSWYVRKP